MTARKWCADFTSARHRVDQGSADAPQAAFGARVNPCVLCVYDFLRESSLEKDANEAVRVQNRRCGN
jgi:hypothetical protein